MELKDLERYRDENGFINIDSLEKEYSIEKLPENRGSSNREKDWFKIDDGGILVRTENFGSDEVPYTSYAELIFEELCKQVDMECAHYDLIIYKGKKGVLSKNVARDNESLVMLKDIMDATGNEVEENSPICIDDILESLGGICEFEKIDKEDRKKIFKDFCKMAVFDIFAMSTDRHSGNAGIGYDGKNARMFPMLDNECSLMLDLSSEDIDRISSDERILNEYVELQNQMIYAPEDEDIQYRNDWENTLNYLCDASPELLNFAEECAQTLDIKKAMTSVEQRTKAELPDRLVNFASTCFERRKEAISKTLLLDIEIDRNEEEQRDEDDYIMG